MMEAIRYDVVVVGGGPGGLAAAQGARLAGAASVLVLERENPFWQTHFPPNGWGCHCKVKGLWPRDLQRLGKSGPDQAPEVNLVERTIGQRSALGPRTVRVPEGIDPESPGVNNGYYPQQRTVMGGLTLTF